MWQGVEYTAASGGREESIKNYCKEKPTGIAGGSSYAAQGPILPAARLRACGLFTCILLLATRKRVFKIQC